MRASTGCIPAAASAVAWASDTARAAMTALSSMLDQGPGSAPELPRVETADVVAAAFVRVEHHNGEAGEPALSQRVEQRREPASLERLQRGAPTLDVATRRSSAQLRQHRESLFSRVRRVSDQQPRVVRQRMQ